MKLTLGKKAVEQVVSVENAEITDTSNQQEMLVESGQKKVLPRGVLSEDESKVTEHQNVFRHNDGTTRQVISSVSKNYLDKSDNKFKKINTCLSKNAEGDLEAFENSFSTKFYAKAEDGKIYSMGKNDCMVVLKANDAVRADVVLAELQENNKAGLENVRDGVDIEYILEPNRIKENIIIKEPQSSYGFDFDIDLTNLNVDIAEDGKSLLLKNNETQDVEFRIPGPVMYDANGEPSDLVSYEIEEEDRNIKIKVVVEPSYMNDSHRAYPVTIDPQISTNDEEVIAYRVEKKSQSSSGYPNSYNENGVDQTFIRVKNNFWEQYRTYLSINKSNISVLNSNISNVKLKLKKHMVNIPGTIKIDDSIACMLDEDISIDITSIFKEYSDATTFGIYIEPSDYNVDGSFYASGENAPELEIEYIGNNDKPAIQTFSLAGVATGALYCGSGELVTAFETVPTTDFNIDYGISHIHKEIDEALGENPYGVGDNFRLNLHEHFEKLNSSTYDYTDPMGIKHQFVEKYYYLDDGNNRMNLSDVGLNESDVTISVDGTMTCVGNGKTHDVFVEYRTSTGLKAMPKLEDIDGAELIEQRTDEQKQLEQQVESYENLLKQYYGFMNPYNADCWGFENCKKLKVYSLDVDTFKIICESYNNVTTLGEINQILSYKDTLGGKKFYDYADEDYKKAEVLSELINKADYNVKQFKDYYKEYVNLKFKLEQMRKHTPVNYLTDDTLYKGFNEYGDLVAIYDSYGNTLAIEYDDNNSTTTRIKRVYDGENKAIIFEYNTSKLLTSITDTRGRKTTFKEEVIETVPTLLVSKSNDKWFRIAFSGDNISKITTSNNLESTLSYSGSKLSTITNSSLIDCISHGKLGETTNITLSSASVGYAEYATTITNKDSNDITTTRAKFVMDSDGNVVENIVEEQGKITKATSYDYIAYDKNNLKSVRDEDLNEVIFSDYISLELLKDTSVKTLDSFNNPSQSIETTSETVTTTTYEYDNNQKCISEITEVEFNNGALGFISHKKNHYNANGSLVKTESYNEHYELKNNVEKLVSEKLTNGISITEYTYDDKGNQIKQVSYNSLDTSSKFYSESIVNEQGKTTAELDARGENKTELEYVGETKLVQTEKLANGSKFAYGYDNQDRVTAISQSTADGEGNSNQTHYTNGFVTQLNSGNNKVNYEYDGKGRMTKIGLNGNNNYLQTAYSDDNLTTTTTNAKGEIFATIKGADGRVEKYIYDEDDNQTIAYSYDAEWKDTGNQIIGKYDTIVDKFAKVEGDIATTITNTIKVYRDTHDRIKRVDRDDATIENYAYDNYGNLTSKIINNSVNHAYSYDYKDDSTKTLESMTMGEFAENYKTDCLGRNKELVQTLGENSFSKQFGYYKNGDHATNRINTVFYGKNGLTDSKTTYTYDSLGNIISINENGKQTKTFTYDNLSRIICEKDLDKNEEKVYTYDNQGNILTKSVNGTIKNYSYGIGTDKLMSFDGESFAYDAVGNPTSYRNLTMTWSKGRQLDSVTDSEGTLNFGYNGLGQRTQKGNISYIYDSNGKLLSQTDGTTKLAFVYGSEGVIGFEKIEGVSTLRYIYKKNLMGDVMAIYNESGTIVATYNYTAFGECAAYNSSGAIDTDDNSIGNINPFRYRSYYYDVETSLYFLKTRYYDPEIGRFITIDDTSYLAPESINGLNLYAYCGNNPVMGYDPEGTWNWGLIGMVALSVVVAVAAVAFSVVTFGAGAVIGAMVAGAAIGAVVGGGFELGAQLIAGNGLDWGKIGRAALGGAVSGAISAIPGLGWGATFMVGGAASVIGGFISGGVVDAKSALMAFCIGGLANVVGKGIGDYILKNKTSAIFNLGKKAKSLAIQSLEGNSRNMGYQALSGSLRNSFKNYSINQIEALLKNANVCIRLGIYSSLTSAGLSTIPYFK